MKLIAAALIVATGSAFAQQTEFVAPDAGSESTLTRAEVHRYLVEAQAQGRTAMREHDGQDTVYARSEKARQDVKIEKARATGDRNRGLPLDSLYFG